MSFEKWIETGGVIGIIFAILFFIYAILVLLIPLFLYGIHRSNQKILFEFQEYVDSRSATPARKGAKNDLSQQLGQLIEEQKKTAELLKKIAHNSTATTDHLAYQSKMIEIDYTKAAPTTDS